MDVNSNAYLPLSIRRAVRSNQREAPALKREPSGELQGPCPQNRGQGTLNTFASPKVRPPGRTSWHRACSKLCSRAQTRKLHAANIGFGFERAWDSNRTGKGKNDALDTVRGLARTVGAGISDVLHAGWIDSHPFALGCRRSCNQPGTRPKDCLMEAAQT
jgi:hypothetical protein